MAKSARNQPDLFFPAEENHEKNSVHGSAAIKSSWKAT
jgi:hypothetical protein